VFKGHYENTINEKGRLSIPSRFREILKLGDTDTLVIAKGLEKCLWAYSPEGWEKVEKKVSGLSSVRMADIVYKRHVMGSAEECQLDGQGRILVPASLRSYANLKRKCLCVGVGDRFEIWDREAYDAFMDDAMKDPASLRKDLAEMGL